MLQFPPKLVQVSINMNVSQVQVMFSLPYTKSGMIMSNKRIVYLDQLTRWGFCMNAHWNTSSVQQFTQIGNYKFMVKKNMLSKVESGRGKKLDLKQFYRQNKDVDASNQFPSEQIHGFLTSETCRDKKNQFQIRERNGDLIKFHHDVVPNKHCKRSIRMYSMLIHHPINESIIYTSAMLLKQLLQMVVSICCWIVSPCLFPPLCSEMLLFTAVSWLEEGSHHHLWADMADLACTFWIFWNVKHHWCHTQEVILFPRTMKALTILYDHKSHI